MRQTANRRRFKNYLIANKIHFRMMIANLILMLLVFAIVIGAVLYPFYCEIFRIGDIYAQHYSARFFVVLLDRLSLSLIAVLLISLLYQIIINHKFCGPLVNFSNTFKKMSQGDLTRKIYLRRYDFLKHEAAQVNAMIDSLSDNIVAVKKDHDLLMAALEDATTGEMPPNEYQNAFNALKKQADICHKRLSVFKIEDKSD
ncbi:MAG: methyl-accepting chemotaxis protein [Deltaproteobacteria bacterium]|jgi:methyl-accepting chemotaxis protein|nr:methyl-accepting chemotaxis protein [Deltaproteobacteria bacterium]